MYLKLSHVSPTLKVSPVDRPTTMALSWDRPVGRLLHNSTLLPHQNLTDPLSSILPLSPLGVRLRVKMYLTPINWLMSHATTHVKCCKFCLVWGVK